MRRPSIAACRAGRGLRAPSGLSLNSQRGGDVRGRSRHSVFDRRCRCTESPIWAIDSGIALPACRGRLYRPPPGPSSSVVAAAGRWVAWYHHEKKQWRIVAGAHSAVPATTMSFTFWRRASFVVSFDTQSIACYPRQFLIGRDDSAAPGWSQNSLAEQGALALHASVVQTSHGALAFVAQTGAGKSTIAAALGARGCAIMADDCAIVDVKDEVCCVRPLAVGLRLSRETLRMLSPRRAVREHSRRTSGCARSAWQPRLSG